MHIIFFSCKYNFLRIYQLNIIKEINKSNKKAQDIKIFFKKKKNKCNNIVVHVGKIAQNKKK